MVAIAKCGPNGMGGNSPDQRPRHFWTTAKPLNQHKATNGANAKARSGANHQQRPSRAAHQMHVPKSHGFLSKPKGAGDSNQPHHRRPGSPTDHPR